MDSRDVDWFVPLTLVMATELWLARSFPLGSLLTTYGMCAAGAALIFAFGAVIRHVVVLYRQGEQRPMERIVRGAWADRSRLAFIPAGLVVVTLGACAITALKSGIQAAVPFYADPALARIDRLLLGQDAWRLAHSLFGWAFTPISTLYGTWLLGQTALLTALLFAAPSKFKSQALITHSLIWLLLGIAMAYACSSAGPIFYDQIYGGTRFSGLHQLIAQSALTAGPEDYLWHLHQSGSVQFGAGISAMPSLHVAGATWLALVFGSRFRRFAALGWIYAALIYIGSIMTGWHWAMDGVVGASGALLLWRLAGQVAGWRSHFAAIPAAAPYEAR